MKKEKFESWIIHKNPQNVYFFLTIYVKNTTKVKSVNISTDIVVPPERKYWITSKIYSYFTIILSHSFPSNSTLSSSHLSFFIFSALHLR